MTKKNSLKKMSRKDLLEVLLIQNKKINELEKELKETKELLENKELILSEAGSLAEASLRINKVFEVAQKAADDYLRNIKKLDKSNNQNEKQEYNKKTVIKKESTNTKE